MHCERNSLWTGVQNVWFVSFDEIKAGTEEEETVKENSKLLCVVVFVCRELFNAQKQWPSAEIMRNAAQFWAWRRKNDRKQ